MDRSYRLDLVPHHIVGRNDIAFVVEAVAEEQVLVEALAQDMAAAFVDYRPLDYEDLRMLPQGYQYHKQENLIDP